MQDIWWVLHHRTNAFSSGASIDNEWFKTNTNALAKTKPRKVIEGFDRCCPDM
jgi:hypothetical protein